MNINKHASNVLRIFTCVAHSEGNRYDCELRYEVNSCNWYDMEKLIAEAMTIQSTLIKILYQEKMNTQKTLHTLFLYYYVLIIALILI